MEDGAPAAAADGTLAVLRRHHARTTVVNRDATTYAHRAAACNPMCCRLPPCVLEVASLCAAACYHALEPASLCAGACTPMRWSPHHPYVLQSATHPM